MLQNRELIEALTKRSTPDLLKAAGLREGGETRAPRETRLRLGPDLATDLHDLATELGFPPADLGRLLLRGGMALVGARATVQELNPPRP